MLCFYTNILTSTLNKELHVRESLYIRELILSNEQHSSDLMMGKRKIITYSFNTWRCQDDSLPVWKLYVLQHLIFVLLSCKYEIIQMGKVIFRNRICRVITLHCYAVSTWKLYQKTIYNSILLVGYKHYGKYYFININH